MPKPLRLGIFIVGSLLLFGAGIFWIGSRQFRFTSTYRLNAAFQNAAGLAAGANVQVGGIHQGTVERIILPPSPDQKIRVEMQIREATRNVVKKDSVASIRTEGLVGDQYVEIGFGSKGAAPVRDGDTITAEAPLQISEMMKKTDAILDSAQSAIRNIDQTAGNLQVMSSKLNTGKGTVGALVNDRSVYEHVNEAAANLQDDTEALKHNFLLRGFFRKRGYEDSDELSRNAISKVPPASPRNRFTFRGDKLFDKPDNAKLKRAKMLDEAGKYLEQNSYGLVVVASYSDRKGDSEKKRQLTEARSVVVRDYLTQHFKLNDMRIRTFGGGKSPDAPDGGEVAVLVYPEGTEAEPKKPEPGK
jgi:phospholipid/cholesterol/gamma-HCH transport system substrate-binding protein